MKKIFTLFAVIALACSSAFAEGLYLKVQASDMAEAPWDSQFWIVLDQELAEGDSWTVSMDVKASKEFTGKPTEWGSSKGIGTQIHKLPGDYLHWSAIGDIPFTTEWKKFEFTGTVPAEGVGGKSIALNLNDCEEANTYYFDNISVKVNDVEMVKNGDLEGDDLSSFAAKEYPNAIMEPTITDDHMEAYYADVAAIKELTDAFQELTALIDEEYPLGVDDEMAAAINAKIMEMNAAVEAALEAYGETGIYESPLSGADTTEVFDLIQAYLQHAEILNAYNTDVATVNEWFTTMQSIMNGSFTITDKVEDLPFEAFYVYKEEEGAALLNQIMSYYNALEPALGAADESGVYESPITPEDARDINTQLLALIAEGWEMYMAILNATEEDMNTLMAYYEKVAEAIDGDNAEPTEAEEALFARLFELQDAVYEAMQKALNETAIYESPLTEEVIAELDAMVETLGISGIIADSNEAIYYDLNGHQVANPATGKVYIKVANGKATKIVK